MDKIVLARANLFFNRYHQNSGSGIIAGMTEIPLGESSKKLPIHEITLGVGFKPFEGATDWYDGLEPIKEFQNIKDYWDHRVFLRRPVSLKGVQGRIDVMSDNPWSIVQYLIRGKDWMVSSDRPLGEVKEPIMTRGTDGKFVENKERAAILRFTFLLKTPADYTKLMSSYSSIDLGGTEFILHLMFNQKKARAALENLRKGKAVLITEKNLFNVKILEEPETHAEEEEDPGIGELSGTQWSDEKIKALPTIPDRITFVTLPVDLEKLRTIEVTFEGFDDWGDSDYPPEPVLPSGRPLPVLAR